MYSPFELLGLDDSATPAEVTGAWRKLANIYHPDKGGDADKFILLKQAYDQALKIAAEPKKCFICGGSGKSITFIGFNSLPLMCSACKGSGLQRR